MHFLGVLIELDDLSYHNLLGFFYFFASSGPLYRYHWRLASSLEAATAHLKTRKNSFYNFQKRENLGLVIYTTNAIIKSLDGDPR